MLNKQIDILYFVLYFIKPYNVEEALELSNNYSNIAYNGIFLDIYNKRNLHYFSLVTIFPSYFYNYTTYGALFSMFTFYLFYISCSRCYYIVSSNYKFQYDK
jgi:hypothetical protein